MIEMIEIIVICGVIYLISRLIFNNILRIKKEVPEIIAAISYVILLFILPSLPRYEFEKKIRYAVSKSHSKIISEAGLGDIIEPLTLFNTPIGIFKIASIYDIITKNLFQITVLRYNEEPIVYLANVDCNTKLYTPGFPRTEDGGIAMLNIWGEDTGFVYAVDKQGAFIVQEMDDKEHESFCVYDWSKERNAIREQITVGSQTSTHILP